ncbi:acetyltransferase [Falsiroseomonas sp. CW058]|uniref:acetyltransferase n=1 Tax=Falsiroseomonas sp. CW058 TaxID=3388664 RepID=UPI003D31D257
MVPASFRFLVLGAGGHARPVIEALHAAGHQVAGLLDDAPGGAVLGHPRLGTLADLDRLAGKGFAVVVAIGANGLRALLGARCVALGLPLPPVVHPSALLSPSATLSDGAQVMARAVVGPGAIIGPLALVNTGAIVEHDCAIGAAAHLGPGAVLCGGVRVGAEALVGAGAVVRPGTVIGAGAVIAPGAAVAEDVADGARMGGVPARPL